MVDNNTGFVNTYFDNKNLEELKKTITPNWSKSNTEYHIRLIFGDGWEQKLESKNVLEIGCGIGRLMKFLSDNIDINIHGCDQSKNMLENVNKYMGNNPYTIHKCEDGLIDCDLDGYFDYIFSIITFQHIPNTEVVKKYLEESYRLLNNSGKLTFQILSKDFDKGFLWTYHNITELTKHLKSIGFYNINMEKDGVWTIIKAEK